MINYQILGYDGLSGETVVLHECDTCAEGILWGRGYLRHGDFGGWSEIILLEGKNTLRAVWDQFEGENIYPEFFG